MIAALSPEEYGCFVKIPAGFRQIHNLRGETDAVDGKRN